MQAGNQFKESGIENVRGNYKKLMFCEGLYIFFYENRIRTKYLYKYTMSLYIHPDNQRVLWTTINKANGFSERRDADQWFKQIIAHFYHQNSHRVLGKDELLKLNKETIEYMIQQLRAPVMPSASVASSMPLVTTYVSSPVTVPVTSVTSPVTALDPDTKMTTSEMNTLLQLRVLQDQIDELREEIRALRKQT